MPKGHRFAPPLILTREQADVAVTMFVQACADVARGVKPQPPIAPQVGPHKEAGFASRSDLEAEGHEEGI